MRMQIKLALALLTLPLATAAQQDAPKIEVGVGYNYVRANILPTCGCFNANGGGASVAVNANKWFGVAGEFSVAHAGNVQGSGRDLTLFTYQAGPRISVRRERGTVFFHALFGGGRAGGSLYDVPLPGRSGTGPDNSFAITLGGGIDIKASPRVAIRVLQADWVHTGFHNSANNKQNSFRLAAGLVFQFGGNR